MTNIERPVGTYRRLLPFLRPHSVRLAAAVACNLLAALFDVFTIGLLIPFLGTLFDQPQFGLPRSTRAAIGSGPGRSPASPWASRAAARAMRWASAA